MKHDTQNLLGLGLLLFGLAIANEAKTTEAKTLGGAIAIGGLACLSSENTNH